MWTVSVWSMAPAGGRSVSETLHVRKCPVCRREIEGASREIFCSERCRRIDLSRWLNEEYRIRGSEGEDEGAVVHSIEPDSSPPPED